MANRFQQGFLLVLVGGISFLFLIMIQDYLMTLFLAALFSALIRPLFNRLEKLTGGRPVLASLLTLGAAILLIMGPIFSLLGIVAKQAVDVTQAVTPWIQDKLAEKDSLNNFFQTMPLMEPLKPYTSEILTKVGNLVSGLGGFILSKLSSLTAGTLLFFLHFAIFLYALFFFLIDGPAILRKILYYLPLENKDEKRLLDGFRSMAKATIKGTFVIGFIQGFLAGLALWLAGIPSVLFWSVLMMVLSMVPTIGAALIWAPACVYLLLIGKIWPGILVFLWCALVVGSADNLLRPRLVGKDTKMHELLILISTLGGLAFFGLTGFVLGPAIALLFLTVWDIYGTAFKAFLPKTVKL